VSAEKIDHLSPETQAPGFLETVSELMVWSGPKSTLSIEKPVLLIPGVPVEADMTIFRPLHGLKMEVSLHCVKSFPAFPLIVSVRAAGPKHCNVFVVPMNTLTTLADMSSVIT
jgi:hypothetical protein